MLVPRQARWDRTTEVVIIGSGCAGAVAAIAAREAGAEVLVLEKQPLRTYHSNTSMAGGGFVCPSDAKGAIQYMEALSRADDGMYWTDLESIKAWAECACTSKAWLETRGGSFIDKPQPAAYPGTPGHEAMPRYCFRGRGILLSKFLLKQLQNRSIPVQYETPATRLLTDSRGGVVGVLADDLAEGKQLKVRATKGVILACGGFEFNETMKLNYLRVHPSYFSGSEVNTGDGVRMAMGVGADLWHMSCVSAHTVMKFPDFPIAIHPALVPGTGHVFQAGPSEDGESAKQCGALITDRFGKRIINEDDFAVPKHAYYYELASYDSQRHVYPRVPSYWIFDRRRIEGGPLPRRNSGAAGPSRLYDWSKDNSREIEKGWITTANTIRDLAGRLELSPDTLEDTLARYNHGGRHVLEGKGLAEGAGSFAYLGQAADLDIGIGELGQGQHLTEAGVGRGFTQAGAAQMFYYEGHLRQRLDKFAQSIRSEHLHLHAGAGHRNLQLFAGAPYRQGVFAGRTDIWPYSDALGSFLHPMPQGLGGIFALGVDIDHRGEPARESARALYQIGVVRLAIELDQGRLVHPVHIHVEEHGFDGFDPVGRGVAVGINDHRRLL